MLLTNLDPSPLVVRVARRSPLISSTCTVSFPDSDSQGIRVPHGYKPELAAADHSRWTGRGIADAHVAAVVDRDVDVVGKSLPLSMNR